MLGCVPNKWSQKGRASDTIERVLENLSRGISEEP
jgi:hypothetical protein